MSTLEIKQPVFSSHFVLEDAILLCYARSLVHIELHLEVKGTCDLMAVIIILHSAISNADQSGKKHVPTLIFINS